MAISVGIAFVLGKPLLRLNGAYFLIATMAVAECARVILLNSPSLGGATGIMFLDKAHSEWYTPVSYTHLDVYKRQLHQRRRPGRRPRPAGDRCV